MQTASLNRAWRKLLKNAKSAVKAIVGFPLCVYCTIKLSRLCKRLADEGVHFEYGDLPQSIHFLGVTIPNFREASSYRTIEKVWMNAESSRSGSNIYERLKRSLVLLKELPSIDEIQIRFNKPVSDQVKLTEALAPLAEIKSLRVIDVHSHKDNDSILLALPRLPHLKSYISFGGEITNSGLAQLQIFPQVESLSFYNELVGVQAVAALKNLKKIELNPFYSFDSSSLESFAGHPTLQSFEYRDLTDEILKILTTCPNLESVISYRSKVTDKGLTHLTKMKRLQFVDLDGSLITDEGFSILSSCQSLEYLYCNNCKLTDAIGPTLCQLTNLRYLRLCSTMVTEKLISYLAPLSKLEAVEFGDMPLDVDVALAFGKRVRPRPIDGWWNTTWYEIYYRLSGDPSATLPYESDCLKLSSFHGLRGRIGSIRRLSDITWARLENTDIDDQDLLALTAACQLDLLIISNTAITAEGLSALTNQKNLEHLVVGPFNNLPVALASVSKIRSLGTVELVGVDRLGVESIESLLNLPDLYALHLSQHAYDEEIAIQLCCLPKLERVQWKNNVYSHEQDIERLRKSASDVAQVASA